MANQLLLLNGPRKQPNLANNAKYVIQGHQFWYQSKARMQLPISE